jgi:Rrf2 family transcriptional regulator, iron-sulfur cluster assembly transcription factor
MFSASCHYGLQAMFYIALHSTNERNVDLSEIAEEKKIPKHFLSKILQLLVKHKLLLSMRGPSGGFKLSKPADQISLIEIVEVIDGLEIFDQCGIEYKPCDPDNPCPIHDEYSAHRNCVLHLFQNKTLEGITEDIQNGDPIVGLDKPPKKNQISDN